MRAVLTCLSPLQHGAFGESAGNATLCRRMTIVSGGEMVRIPCVSGNALRGVMRRLVMRDLLDTAGLSRANFEPGQWDRLYAALANGGHLVGSETRVDPDRIRALREALPPLSVFGAALYSWMLAGHMSVGILWPRCRETRRAGWMSPAATDTEKSADTADAEAFVEEITHCRHVEREDQDPARSGVTPMPTTMEVLVPGTVLESEILFARHASELERGVIAYALSLLAMIGGKGAAGLGRVAVEARGQGVEDQRRAYLAWRDGSVEAVRTTLFHLAEECRPERQSVKGKRAKPIDPVPAEADA